MKESLKEIKKSGSKKEKLTLFKVISGKTPLLEGLRALREQRNPNKQLLNGVREGDLDKVKNALERGATADAKAILFRWPALVLAAGEGHQKIVDVLLEHGADMNAKNNGGVTALMSAAGGGHLEIVKTLIKHGADMNARAEHDWTALMYAASSGHKEVVRFLLDNNDADPNTKSKKEKRDDDQPSAVAA